MPRSRRTSKPDSESIRLEQDGRRERNWKRWGPYLAERQWGTVREDYSADGDCWNYLPHEHAPSRAYRWGEDGLLGITDRECRLCFALALWNGRDPILKERLFGLTNPQGNHGEDVKECYYYLDSTPTHSYMKALYKYPQAEFPYRKLVEENRTRGLNDPEYELPDTGVFDDDRYFDVQVEYAKAGPDDLLIRITISNRAAQAAVLHVLPTLWFRNTWSWGAKLEESGEKPRLHRSGDSAIAAHHETLGVFELHAHAADDQPPPQWLFTENDTNAQRLFGSPSESRYAKDAFHDCVVAGNLAACSPEQEGTKAAAHYQLKIAARSEVTLCLRLCAADDLPRKPFGKAFDDVFKTRQREADAFYAHKIPAHLDDEQRSIARQAYAGMLWSKQFYHYVVQDWLEGDPLQPPPPPQRARSGPLPEWLAKFVSEQAGDAATSS